MKRLFITLFFLASLVGAFAQTEGVGINKTGTDPESSAMLDVQSTEKGFLMPRMTTAQRNNITDPVAGLYIYNLDDSCFNYYTGEVWVKDCGRRFDLDPETPSSQNSSASTNVLHLGEAPDNTLYVVGRYVNDLSLGSFSLTNPGGNIYLARYNPGTGEYLWGTNLLAGVGNTIADIATDSSGNILLMGRPNGGLSTVGGLPITNSVGGYVVKIDPDGNTQWLYEIISGSVGSVNALATDASGRISFCGRYINTIDFGGTTLSSPTEDIFLATLNANGTLDNVQGNFVTTPGSFSPDALALDIDAQGNRYLGGYVNGTYTFGSTVLTAPTGQAHPFITKFDAAGNVQWAQSFPSPNIALIKRIAVAPDGNVYVAGGYQTSLTIGGTTLTPTGGTEGSFVSLLDPSGTVLWTRGVGPLDQLDKMFMDVGQGGEVYLAASFDASLQVAGQTLTPSSPNKKDAVVLQFQPDGTLGWVQQSGGSQDEFGEEVLYAAGDKIYVGGYFSSNPATFGSATLAHTGPFFSGYIWPIDALTGGNATLDGLSSSQDNDRDASNELQTLSINGSNLSISNGNSIALPTDLDGDPTNELQDWTTLPNIPSDFADNIDNVVDADADSTNELQHLEQVLIMGSNANGQAITNLSSLEVSGSITMQDGNQQDGYVMTSDANGVARWQNPSSSRLEDTDTDTRVEVEAFSDEDIIRMTVAGEESFLVDSAGIYSTGTLDGNNLPYYQGAGTRFMWLPGTSALRIGTVNGSQWNTANLLFFSSVLGGRENIISGSGQGATIAGGFQNSITASQAFVGAGQVNSISGSHSGSVAGIGNQVSGRESFVGAGNGNQASGFRTAVAGGAANVASGDFSSIAGGGDNTTLGAYSHVMGGLYNTAPSYSEAVTGMFADLYTPISDSSWVGQDRIFSVGNGTSTAARNNALTLLKNGNLGLGTTTPDTTLHVVGQIRYEDGNEQNGYVLTSDANGVASWQAPATDNLGNHIATQNLSLGTHWLSGDGGNEGIFVDGTGNVGIGTPTPSQPLSVFSSGGSWTQPVVKIRSSNTTSQAQAGIGFYGPSNTLLGRIGVNLEPNLGGFGGTEGLQIVCKNGEQVRIGDGDGVPGLVVDGATETVVIGSSPTSPFAKLEVLGSVNRNLAQVGFLNVAGATGSYNPPAFPYSIAASHVVLAQEFHAQSDFRIKNIEGVSNGATDLHTLMNIQVTDYRLRDTIQNGSRPIKKVIAQQVDEVYPQAVTTDLTKVVPDIYQRAEMQEGWILLATDLKVGERVKLITEKATEVYEVTAVEADRFQVSGLAYFDLAQHKSRSEAVSPLASRVFVYGREVDDFHTVDYEAISMLNVSATQELKRIIDAQQAEIDAVKAENIRLQAEIMQLQGLEARLQTLEATLAKP